MTDTEKLQEILERCDRINKMFEEMIAYNKEAHKLQLEKLDNFMLK